MQFIDFNKTEIFEAYYEGNAGGKQAVVYDDTVWMLKLPKSTKELVKPQISYTTSPLSEYLGSQIYGLLGIPVHATLLGCYGSKIVVGCKDFTFDGMNEVAKIIPFHALKNTFMVSDLDSYSGSGSETWLNEVLDTIVGQKTLRELPGSMERFWDMFVIDAFIGNNDRNNGNWGILKTLSTGEYALTPVFDNGNAFYNKKSLESMVRNLETPSVLDADAYQSPQCVYKYLGQENKGHQIRPFQMIESLSRGESAEIYNTVVDIRGLLGDALLRFEERIDMASVIELIEDIPESAFGMSVMPVEQKMYYTKLLEIRYEKMLLPAVKNLRKSRKRTIGQQ